MYVGIPVTVSEHTSVAFCSPVVWNREKGSFMVGSNLKKHFDLNTGKGKISKFHSVLLDTVSSGK